MDAVITFDKKGQMCLLTNVNGTAQVREISKKEKKQLENVTVAAGKNKIPEKAFAKMENLKTVNFSSSISELSNGIFYDCPNLESVLIPASVTKIPDNAFGLCCNLKEIEGLENIREIGKEAFLHCESIETTGNLINIKNIEERAFDSCYSLKDVRLGNSLSEIKNGTFENCNSLEQITLPDNVTNIGQSAFENCTKLESVKLPDVLEDIEKNAFYNNVKLNEIILPYYLHSIDSNAFGNCVSLKELDIPVGTMTQYDTFNGCNLEKVNIGEKIKEIETMRDNDLTELWNQYNELMSKAISYGMDAGTANGIDSVQKMIISTTVSYQNQLSELQKNGYVTEDKSIQEITTEQENSQKVSKETQQTTIQEDLYNIKQKSINHIITAGKKSAEKINNTLSDFTKKIMEKTVSIQEANLQAVNEVRFTLNSFRNAEKKALTWEIKQMEKVRNKINEKSIQMRSFRNRLVFGIRQAFKGNFNINNNTEAVAKQQKLLNKLIQSRRNKYEKVINKYDATDKKVLDAIEKVQNYVDKYKDGDSQILTYERSKAIDEQLFNSVDKKVSDFMKKLNEIEDKSFNNAELYDSGQNIEKLFNMIQECRDLGSSRIDDRQTIEHIHNLIYVNMDNYRKENQAEFDLKGICSAAVQSGMSLSDIPRDASAHLHSAQVQYFALKNNLDNALFMDFQNEAAVKELKKNNRDDLLLPNHIIVEGHELYVSDATKTLYDKLEIQYENYEDVSDRDIDDIDKENKDEDIDIE